MSIPYLGQQIHCVTNFQDLVATPFSGAVNAVCWTRKLVGDFSEIVEKVAHNGNITIVEQDDLRALLLSEQGQLAREMLLHDMKALEAQGASPMLNVINQYDRDDINSFFPTDVYSFHADYAPEPLDTFLCTYYGEPSEILPNSQAVKKVLIPEIRDALQQQYHGASEDFEFFLSEHCYDLHYQPIPNACPIKVGLGNLWRLAVDYPGSPVLPCIHRAPREKPGQPRLLLIC
ncbi:hypothetical protein GA0116948_104198 [Chitinophaga costaii]|uniref:DUF1826 domain-containing protein n=1 Tax=Chitinophaga costaii TaxID=1335309 RepID=A0A1C4CM66_9BACT|nr:hypothetical protein [Chitinophaga costaii]PUZ27031.1 hypothetical protein DCM91_07305 [Chitinophaga costaii]SCC20196.1 hypothetical protein GA0116948_104198 [Chitinophaga costaii]